jgi:diguanylate cyclase (GGDEF)-like protein
MAMLVGLFAVRPGSPWMRLLLSPGAGGHAARRLIPALIVAPIAAGYALVIGVEHDWFSTAVGAAFAIAAIVAALISALVLTSRELEHADADRSRLQSQLADLADRDPLTDVFNRRRLDEELRRQLALVQRGNSRLAVLSIDLDGFKATNDAHGHATGDELLLATAEVLREELRASDFICRPGGDEFIVLLPGTGEEEARIVAGKLIRSMRAVSRPKPGGGVIQLRASLGIAVSDESGWISPDDLLAAADRALYAAKQAGGDRFAVEESLVLD